MYFGSGKIVSFVWEDAYTGTFYKVSIKYILIIAAISKKFRT
ncbi:hypothetical protein FDUTEX481_05919 [Tolypothrix sp. PCC 7601]|nr:hypothetical protein FDUTEX481_05919 [Tolypothrix sp. PCC 7601]